MHCYEFVRVGAVCCIYLIAKECYHHHTEKTRVVHIVKITLCDFV